MQPATRSPDSPQAAPRVVRAKEEHLPAILAISNWAAVHTAANMATEPESLTHWQGLWHQHANTHPWLVALSQQQVVGFAKAAPFRPRGAFAWTAETSVYIRTGNQGSGVGRALYGALIPLLQRQGYATLVAMIAVPNAASEALHTAYGFRPMLTWQQIAWKHGRWHDLAEWSLRLRANDTPPGSLRSVQDCWQDPPDGEGAHGLDAR